MATWLSDASIAARQRDRGHERPAAFAYV